MLDHKIVSVIRLWTILCRWQNFALAQFMISLHATNLWIFYHSYDGCEVRDLQPMIRNVCQFVLCLINVRLTYFTCILYKIVHEIEQIIQTVVYLSCILFDCIRHSKQNSWNRFFFICINWLICRQSWSDDTCMWLITNMTFSFIRLILHHPLRFMVDMKANLLECDIISANTVSV